MSEMHKYEYNGPVMEFNRLLANRWYGETTAVSPGKAKSNLAYRFKRYNNRSSDAKITLPGEIKLVH